MSHIEEYLDYCFKDKVYKNTNSKYAQRSKMKSKIVNEPSSTAFQNYQIYIKKKRVDKERYSMLEKWLFRILDKHHRKDIIIIQKLYRGISVRKRVKLTNVIRMVDRTRADKMINAYVLGCFGKNIWELWGDIEKPMGVKINNEWKEKLSLYCSENRQLIETRGKIIYKMRNTPIDITIT
jgi:hypothetical protein